MLHGHGTRDREARGPDGVDDLPRAVVVLVRRFLCRYTGCEATCTVGPSELLPRRRYTAVAIALALALWGMQRVPAREVRQRVSPDVSLGPTACTGWAALPRWARSLTWGAAAAASLAARERARQTAEHLLARSALPLSASPIVRVLAAAHSVRSTMR